MEPAVIAAIHESGHAIAAASIHGIGSIVSIVVRSNGTGEVKYSPAVEYLHQRAVFLVSGIVAEFLLTNDVWFPNGVDSDKDVRQLRMIPDTALLPLARMSARLGPVTGKIPPIVADISSVAVAASVVACDILLSNDLVLNSAHYFMVPRDVRRVIYGEEIYNIFEGVRRCR